jgi:hypothetical protein
MAILALYLVKGNGKSLPEYLDEEIFSQMEGLTMPPDPETVAGYEEFIKHYKAGLAIEKSAIENANW